MIRTDLLRQLAEHLLHGKLGHKVFDFSKYNDVKDDSIILPYTCATLGCAIGECPIIFPESWMFDVYGFPVLKNRSTVSSRSGQLFFEISHSAYEYLFVPCEQFIEKFGGDYLYSSATKEQVANNILIFCDKAEKGDFE